MTSQRTRPGWSAAKYGASIRFFPGCRRACHRARIRATRWLIRATLRLHPLPSCFSILTRPISPLLYLTVGFFIDHRSFRRSPKREDDLLVMPGFVPGIHVFCVDV